MHKSDKPIIVFRLLIVGRVEHILGNLWLERTGLLLSILVIFIKVIEFGDIGRRRNISGILSRLRFNEAFDRIYGHTFWSYVGSILIFSERLISFLVVIVIVGALVQITFIVCITKSAIILK